MKTRLLTLVFTIALLAVISGAYFISSRGDQPLPADIKFDPKFIEWDGAAPSIWAVWVQSSDGAFNPLYIDGASVMFEGILPAIGGYYQTGKWIAQFDGQSVFNILASKIGHMGVPPDISTKTPVHYYFTVSAALVGAKGYPDGTPVEGEGWIAVRFIHGLPLPPP